MKPDILNSNRVWSLSNLDLHWIIDLDEGWQATLLAICIMIVIKTVQTLPDVIA
jgi:hypothetical protein